MLGHALVIEDELLIALEVEDHLRGLGYTSVDIAGSPTDALDHALRRRPDLITADVQIVGGTGVEAVKAIRQRLGEIPYFYLTGNVEIVAGEGVGVVDKPIDPGLFAKVHGRTIQGYRTKAASSAGMSGCPGGVVQAELAILRACSLKYPPAEAAMRLRALAELTTDLSTDLLLRLAAAATDGQQEAPSRRLSPSTTPFNRPAQ
ncbi:MAG: hypothetical protein DI570_16715 [Phenylobacterium zucineum]|nr:MAG: hypothetical protein DI570_16715 [Phenylobacterium zucineum]